MAGRAAGIFHQGIGMRGFGAIVDLSVAMSNDLDFGSLVKTQSAARTRRPAQRLESQAQAA